MKAIVANGGWEGHKLILAKPQTYMNLSGDAAAALVRFYKVPQDRFLVIYDDLDLPFGALRLRPDGGPGGQKGVASVISRLGTQKFGRLRVGIGRPPGQMDPSAFLLQDFSSKELELMAPVIDRAVQAVQTFIRSGLDTAMNQYNGTNPS
jgi:PTH1 family peptidyl-tRNA hydrolase